MPKNITYSDPENITYGSVARVPGLSVAKKRTHKAEFTGRECDAVGILRPAAESSPSGCPDRAWETQDSVTRWAEQTFKFRRSNLQLATRANEEMAECLSAVCSRAPIPEIASEIADVLIVLSPLSSRFSIGIHWMPIEKAAPKSESGNLKVAAHKAAKANMLMSGLVTLLTLNDSHLGGRVRIHKIVFELRNLANKLDIDLELAVADKMAINRRREWTERPSGFYHLASPAPQEPALLMAGS